MKVDLHIRDWADLRVSTNPPSSSGCFFISRQGVLSTWCIHIIRSFLIKCNEELSFLNILRKTRIGAELGQFLIFRKFCEFLLVFSQQVFLYIRVSTRKSVRSGKFCRFLLLIPNSHLRRVSLHLESLWLILYTDLLLLRRYWADLQK